MSSTSPSQYRTIGICLAIGSGLLIGSSFVFKKKGLLRSQAGGPAGEGVAYLKSPIWWVGMIMMIAGEICNFGAYAFVEAIVVTPMGALSVVISAILSHYFLNERLTVFGWIGCTQCILGALLIALNAPQEQTATTIAEFQHLFVSVGFLVYGGLCIASALIIIFFIAPKYGKKSMMWYISICSVIGGLSVSCTSGLGACILTSIRGNNQFHSWFIYFLIFFVACTLLTEIYYLNCALAVFNTAMVTPTYYVLFTFFTLVSSVILYQGLKASVATILTIAFSFLVICSGIVILQMSKVDPRRLTVDRKTTILLQAAREEVRSQCDDGDEDDLLARASEEPGMDALAGRFSGIGGTFVRARRRTNLQHHALPTRSRAQALQTEAHVHKCSRTRCGTRKERPGSAASAPPGAIMVGSRRSHESTGMSSVHARQLQQGWLDEAQGSRELGATSSEERTTDEMLRLEGVPSFPSSDFNEKVRPSWVDDSGAWSGRIEMPSRMEEGRLLSEGPVMASPLERSSLGMRSTPSVHFMPQSDPGHGSAPGMAASTRPSSTSTNNNSHDALLVLHPVRSPSSKLKKGGIHRRGNSPRPDRPEANANNSGSPSKEKDAGLRLPNLPKPVVTAGASGTQPTTPTLGFLNLSIPTSHLNLPAFFRRSRSHTGTVNPNPDVEGVAAGANSDVRTDEKGEKARE